MDPRIDELRETALKLHAKGKYHPEEEAYAQLTQLEPQNPRWHQKLGEVRRHLG